MQAGFINKVVGNISSEKMVDGYDYGSEESIYNLNIRGKLDFVPNIDAIQIRKRSKPMDFIISIPFGGIGVIVSNKLSDIILDHIVPVETQIFDAYALYKDMKYHYKYIYVYNARENEILDWRRSTFIETSVGGEIVGCPINFSFEELVATKTRENKYYKPNRLVLKREKINSDIFRLDYTFNGYYISETLKKAIEKAGCEGVDLIPIDQLGFEVDFV